ncbi:MAG: methyltransferase domain-containing protein, partial [Pseudomonadota bacterium]|nr:methyltransferase domain-containing protein [Pseudomonadota bacterium]
FGMRMNNTYTPVDLVRFSKTTVLADLNDNGFPEGEWDCALALALLEHIHDVPALLTKVRSSCQRLICIYVCQEDVGEVEVRRANGFFNDFSRAELRGFFEAAGWRVAVSATEDVGTLFVCE